MDGLMMRLGLSGLRLSSFHRLQNGTKKPLNRKKLKNTRVMSPLLMMKNLPYRRFYSSMTGTAHTQLWIGLNMPVQIISSCIVFHHTQLTGFNLLMWAALALFKLHGLIDVMKS